MIHTAFHLLARLTDALHTFIQIFRRMNGLPLKAVNLDIKVTEKESLQPKGILPP